MSHRAPRPISEALAGLTGRLEPATPLASVQRVWAAAVGEKIAAVARPSAERDGVLTVICTDAVWSAEIELLGPQLADHLNEALGRRLVERLRCRSA